jgi:hypothetical protein
MLGASVVSVGVLGFAMAHGTSLSALYDAMGPFRIEARKVAGLQPLQAERIRLMAMALLAGGLLPLLGYAVWRLKGTRQAADRTERAIVAGLVAVVAYDAVAVVFGGGYWSHYLVQLIVPVAILAGVAVASVQPRVWTALILVLALVAIGTNVARVLKPVRAPGAGVGAVVRHMAEHGDTILSMYGDPTIMRASGLESPYPYLWTLPMQVRDPRLAQVDALLSGPDAPTWVVLADQVQVWGLDVTHLKQTFAKHYVPVRRACGMGIYLRKDVSRPVDLAPASCMIDLKESWS